MIAESILEGQRVRLRPPQEGDLPLFVRWFNDPDVRYWLSMSDASELTLESEWEWYDEMRGDPTRVVWCIETREGRPIGNLGLHAIDEGQGRATLGIAIGEKEQWSRGYGTEAIRGALRYGFEEMGLRRVDLQVDEDNRRGIRCYEKCGFVREGLLRAHRIRKGQPVNAVAMSVLREEWNAEREGGAIEDRVIQGEKIRLRPPEERDLPLYMRWFNDPDVRHWLHSSERAQDTLESQRERFEDHRRDAAWIEWCIEGVDRQTIGCVGLVRIDETHGGAELYIFIGEKDCWSRGYGTEAIRSVLKYAFDELGLRRVELTTDEDNRRGVRCFEKCGFTREGLLRAKRLRHGQPLNLVAMSILREEFESQPWR